MFGRGICAKYLLRLERKGKFSLKMGIFFVNTPPKYEISASFHRISFRAIYK
jgi:hypothetical protein